MKNSLGLLSCVLCFAFLSSVLHCAEALRDPKEVLLVSEVHDLMMYSAVFPVPPFLAMEKTQKVAEALKCLPPSGLTVAAFLDSNFDSAIIKNYFLELFVRIKLYMQEELPHRDVEIISASEERAKKLTKLSLNLFDESQSSLVNYEQNSSEDGSSSSSTLVTPTSAVADIVRLEDIEKLKEVVARRGTDSLIEIDNRQPIMYEVTVDYKVICTSSFVVRVVVNNLVDGNKVTGPYLQFVAVDEEGKDRLPLYPPVPLNAVAPLIAARNGEGIEEKMGNFRGVFVCVSKGEKAQLLEKEIRVSPSFISGPWRSQVEVKDVQLVGPTPIASHTIFYLIVELEVLDTPFITSPLLRKFTCLGTAITDLFTAERTRMKMEGQKCMLVKGGGVNQEVVMICKNYTLKNIQPLTKSSISSHLVGGLVNFVYGRLFEISSGIFRGAQAFANANMAVVPGAAFNLLTTGIIASSIMRTFYYVSALMSLLFAGTAAADKFILQENAKDKVRRETVESARSRTINKTTIIMQERKEYF